MEKFVKQTYKFSGPLAQVQARLDSLAKSDGWGSGRAAWGCLVAALGMGLATGELLISKYYTPLPEWILVLVGFPFFIGMLVFFHYCQYDVEDRRHELPIQFLQNLGERLDANREIRLGIDLRDNCARPIATRKESPGFLQATVRVTEYQFPWLVLEMYTVQGQRLRLKIVRTGERAVSGSGRSQTTVHSYHEVVSLFLENPGQVGPPPELPVFNQLSAETVGNTCTLEATGHQQVTDQSSPLFSGADVASLACHMLNSAG